ncbi:hypothetical protein T190_30220 [Sinorhizobium meliloti CCBAU 01290]|nr:hypothetical protein T190_30220 [Sinorhizobium meliloti CCBAU 01290]
MQAFALRLKNGLLPQCACEQVPEDTADEIIPVIFGNGVVHSLLIAVALIRVGLARKPVRGKSGWPLPIISGIK